MSELFSWDKPEKLLGDLCGLVAERSPAEREIPARYAAQTESADSAYRETSQQRTAEYEQARKAKEVEFERTRRRALRRSETDYRAAEQQFEESRADLARRFEDAEWTVEHRWKTARWEANAVFEATKDQPFVALQDVEKRLETAWEELGAVHAKAVEVLQRRRQWREFTPPAAEEVPPRENALRRVMECVAEAQGLLQRLELQKAAAWFEGAGPLSIFLLAGFVALLPSLATLLWSMWLWAPLSVVGGVVGGTVVTLRLKAIARRESEEVYQALARVIAQAAPARVLAQSTARQECERQHAEMVAKLEAEVAKADAEHTSRTAEVAAQKKADFRQFDEDRTRRLAEIATERQRELEAIDRGFTQQLHDQDERYREDSARRTEEHSQATAGARAAFRRKWDEMADRWYAGMARFHILVHQMNLACEAWFPDWNAPDFDTRLPSGNPPPIRYGRMPVDLQQMAGGMPADERLRPTQTRYDLPAVLPFPHRSLLLIKAAGAGRRPAIELLRAAMLRILTSLPPAKVRFMILDPIGLGESFGAFMHLADYDEQLVSSRIWTESAQMERRLTDLTEHMENVLQSYLRNEYRSIQEYNAEAGAMAEPYRVLVIAGFPAGFTESAAKRLTSIVASGAQCGVYTMISVDPTVAMPRDFRLADLESYAATITWDHGRFVCPHPQFGPVPLEPDTPPAAERFTAIIRAAGRRAEEVGRVEVPFASVVPEESTWWNGDSRSGIDVPIGRVGATKMQRMQLGRGTSQHVLAAGKTGSGKSTLWHVLITNLAIHYSPDELELYLVDFKKGVEFKAYAQHRLPHARVVAIESEREFGLSVLERLDAELQARGEKFRQLGVQDVRSYRAAAPEERLPRVLLVVDEFQELFVEDDRVAQRGALLLDRLVRQGRAFGIHVLLGSQTLAGSYSLPRSTLGQMAVRIALQCSEADAHLILSEENTAARLLTRPGEAIYNDANGLYEGNHPFQVVWLTDAEREEYLARVAALACQRKVSGPPAIVFEGSADADISANEQLRETLAGSIPPVSLTAPRLWLGAPVAIREPTSAVLARQSASNLVVIGHREEAALGVLSAAVVSLAAQRPAAAADASPPVFVILDGARQDAQDAGYWRRLAAALPLGAKVAAPRDTAASIGEVAAILERRREAAREDDPGLYLVVYNLSRFPELRRSDDDYGFSRHGENQPPSPAKLFAKILRDGPGLGIHTLIWCDTYNSLNRALDRQGLHDLELRVLLQMNAADSSQLIDSPAASQLGPHRAILYQQGLGQWEKFRPYGLPGEEWLAAVGRQLSSRNQATNA